MAVGVPERVHAGRLGEAIREVAFVPPLVRDSPHRRGEFLDRDHPNRAEALEQAVQHVHGRAGVVECTVGGSHLRVEELGQRRQFVVRHLVATEHGSGQSGGVDGVRVLGESSPSRSQAALRKLES